MRTSSPLTPTYFGHIASTLDALILFEACLNGTLNHVPRRPHDRERAGLIKSGNVFIYEEHSSGIKRWTDGVPWSPSRILGNFLIYRELEHAFPPGEKKRAMKRDKRPPAISKAMHPYGRYATTRPGAANLDSHRHLVGSLTDSYEFKTNGLVKKTISVTIGNVSHHLVSYYSVDDVLNGHFNNPSKEPRFQHIVPRMELTTKQSFRTPLDEVEPMDRMDAYDYGRGRYDMATPNMLQRPLSLNTLPFNNNNNYSSSQPVYTNSFSMPSVVSPNPLTIQSTGAGYSGYTPAPVTYPGPRTEQYDASRPRFNSMGSTEVGHGMMSAHQIRRPSAYEQTTGSLDSATSVSSFKSEATTDSGYSTQSYYTSSRDISQTPTAAYAPQRALPGLPANDTRQLSYDRPLQTTAYNVSVDQMPREPVWPMGNVATGHGHFSPPLQQWASAGTS